jgi:DNA-binding beta-propeller fold protein YncE
VLRRIDDEVPGAQPATAPAPLAAALPVSNARVIGHGWLSEPRGIAVRDDGVVAVADVGLSTVLLFDAEGKPLQVAFPGELQQPEAVAWTRGGLLVIADTWAHRAVLFDPARRTVQPLPEPPKGWYGPRGVAAAPDGTLAVTDTGNKRLVLLTTRDGVGEATAVGTGGSAAGEFVEPVGITWSANDRLLVCDTGNHRLQEVDRDGGPLRAVALPGAWSEFYSRPQVAVLGPDLWLVSDTPASTLWLIRDGRPIRIDLGADGIAPSGIAFREGSLYVADISGRLWVFDLNLNR